MIAIFCFRQVIRSFGRGFKLHFAALFAYGVPLVIVLLNSGVTLGHIDMNYSGIFYINFKVMQDLIPEVSENCFFCRTVFFSTGIRGIFDFGVALVVVRNLGGGVNVTESADPKKRCDQPEKLTRKRPTDVGPLFFIRGSPCARRPGAWPRVKSGHPRTGTVSVETQLYLPICKTYRPDCDGYKDTRPVI